MNYVNNINQCYKLNILIMIILIQHKNINKLIFKHLMMNIILMLIKFKIKL